MKSTSFKLKLKTIDNLLDQTLKSYKNNDEFLSQIISSQTISSLKDHISDITIHLSKHKKVFQKLSNKCVQFLYLFYNTFSQKNVEKKTELQLSAALELIKEIYFNNSSHNENLVQFVYIKYLHYLINKTKTRFIKDYLENLVKENRNEKLIVEIICILLSDTNLVIFSLIPELNNKIFAILSDCQDLKLKIKLLSHIEKCLREKDKEILGIYLRSFPKLLTIFVKLLNKNTINNYYIEILIQNIFTNTSVITNDDLTILIECFFQQTSFEDINVLNFNKNISLEEMKNSTKDQDSFLQFQKTSSVLIKNLLKTIKK